MRSINKWWRLVWIGYTLLLTMVVLVGGLLIWAGNADNESLRYNYQKELNENRELKKKIVLMNNKTRMNEIQSEPTAIPTETVVVSPTFASSEIDLAPTDNQAEKKTATVAPVTAEKLIKIYGAGEDILLGEVKLKKFLKEPLAGSYLPGIASYSGCLPGAERSYRSGYHQGVDFYSYDSGNPCTYGTEVHCVGDGIIVRIDHDFQEMKNVYRDQILDKMAKIDSDKSRNIATDEEYQQYFDLMRGRQVVIDHQNGLFSDYCHLSGVNDDLNVGDAVTAGQLVGYLGNSGTSKGAEDYDAGEVIGLEYCQNPSAHQLDMIKREWHFHLEIWCSPDKLNDPILKSKFVRWNSFKKLFGY